MLHVLVPRIKDISVSKKLLKKWTVYFPLHSCFPLHYIQAHLLIWRELQLTLEGVKHACYVISASYCTHKELQTTSCLPPFFPTVTRGQGAIERHPPEHQEEVASEIFSVQKAKASAKVLAQLMEKLKQQFPLCHV